MAQAAAERGDHVLVAEDVHPVIVVEDGGDGGAAPVARLQAPSRCPSHTTVDGSVLAVTIPCLAHWAPLTSFWHVPKPNLLPLACHAVLDAPRIDRVFYVGMVAM